MRGGSPLCHSDGFGHGRRSRDRWRRTSTKSIDRGFDRGKLALVRGWRKGIHTRDCIRCRRAKRCRLTARAGQPALKLGFPVVGKIPRPHTIGVGAKKRRIFVRVAGNGQFRHGIRLVERPDSLPSGGLWIFQECGGTGNALLMHQIQLARGRSTSKLFLKYLGMQGRLFGQGRYLNIFISSIGSIDAELSFLLGAKLHQTAI